MSPMPTATDDVTTAEQIELWITAALEQAEHSTGRRWNSMVRCWSTPMVPSSPGGTTIESQGDPILHAEMVCLQIPGEDVTVEARSCRR